MFAHDYDAERDAHKLPPYRTVNDSNFCENSYFLMKFKNF